MQSRAGGATVALTWSRFHRGARRRLGSYSAGLTQAQWCPGWGQGRCPAGGGSRSGRGEHAGYHLAFPLSPSSLFLPAPPQALLDSGVGRPLDEDPQTHRKSQHRGLPPAELPLDTPRDIGSERTPLPTGDRCCCVVCSRPVLYFCFLPLLCLDLQLPGPSDLLCECPSSRVPYPWRTESFSLST